MSGETWVKSGDRFEIRPGVYVIVNSVQDGVVTFMVRPDSLNATGTASVEDFQRGIKQYMKSVNDGGQP